MKYTPINFELKDGRICKIREIQVKDAAETVEYLKTVMGESDFLYSYPVFLLFVSSLCCKIVLLYFFLFADEF